MKDNVFPISGPYKVGDRVRTGDGKQGVIKDVLISFDYGGYYFLVLLDGESNVLPFHESDLTLCNNANYSLALMIEENTVCVAIHKQIGDEKKTVACEHAHIMQEGDAGVVQAVSYAFKRAYESFSTGTRYIRSHKPFERSAKTGLWVPRTKYQTKRGAEK